MKLISDLAICLNLLSKMLDNSEDNRYSNLILVDIPLYSTFWQVTIE